MSAISAINSSCSSWRYKSGLGEALWRTQTDHYLAQTAVFREGDVIVDVGAHIGVFPIYLAKKYPFVRVYAIEPDPINYAGLLRNIELNGVTNVTALNKALSGNGQDRTLHVDAWNSGWSIIDATTASARSLLWTVQVGTVTLEQLFEAYEIRHCRLMKITAPGAIRESLIGFRRRGCVDFLCGEADLEDCSRVKLKWRVGESLVSIFGGHLHGKISELFTPGCTRCRPRMELEGLGKSAAFLSGRNGERESRHLSVVTPRTERSQQGANVNR